MNQPQPPSLPPHPHRQRTPGRTRTRDEGGVDQAEVLECGEGSQLPQQLVRGVRVAAEHQLLQGAAEEELQRARTQQPLARHVAQQQLRQLRGQTSQAAAVLHAGS